MQAYFSAFYSSIPHAWYDNSTFANYEGYYARVFYSYFASLGLLTTRWWGNPQKAGRAQSQFNSRNYAA
jgi:hypothetical protein